MLSYSWGGVVGSAWPNREDLLALKDVLQHRRYKCWIDLDWMMGNMDKAFLAFQYVYWTIHAYFAARVTPMPTGSSVMCGMPYLVHMLISH